MWKRKASEEEGCEVEEILQPVKKTGRTARARPRNQSRLHLLRRARGVRFVEMRIPYANPRAEGRRRVALRKTTTRARPCPGLQRLLQRLEEKEKDAAAYQFNKDKDWKLSEKERSVTPNRASWAMAMKRFFSEEPEDDGPAKKQVFDKGKARSVSALVVSQPPLTPGMSAKASRSTSLQVSQTSKK
ncbi:hypothetical protein J3E68DRAFT_429394 [Trichoderma sp. SZMC 28012]